MAKRTFTGKVISTKMQKTVVVAVEMPKKHALYTKSIKQTKKFLVRNELGVVMHDLVVIEESRPLSSKVSWVIVKKLEDGGGK